MVADGLALREAVRRAAAFAQLEAAINASAVSAYGRLFPCNNETSGYKERPQGVKNRKRRASGSGRLLRKCKDCS